MMTTGEAPNVTIPNQCATWHHLLLSRTLGGRKGEAGIETAICLCEAYLGLLGGALIFRLRTDHNEFSVIIFPYRWLADRVTQGL